MEPCCLHLLQMRYRLVLPFDKICTNVLISGHLIVLFSKASTLHVHQLASQRHYKRKQTARFPIYSKILFAHSNVQENIKWHWLGGGGERDGGVLRNQH